MNKKNDNSCKSRKDRPHRIKRNFPFGKKSRPRRQCKDCSEVIKFEKGSRK